MVYAAIRGEDGEGRGNVRPEHDVVRRLQTLWGWWPRLVAFAKSRGASVHEAEDVASLVVLRVAMSENFNDDVADPWPYLAITAVRLLYDERRRVVRDEITSRDGRYIPRQRSFEEEMVDRDLAQRGLDRIKATESDLVADMMLRRADGLTWAEVFAEFGLSFSAGQSRIWRAQQRTRHWRDRLSGDNGR